MDGTVLKKVRLLLILEHKVRVSIIYSPLFSVVYSLCFKKCFSFSKLFKVFLALCCIAMPLLVNFFGLYFQRSMYSIVCIPFGFDERRTAQKITLFETNIFLSCVKSRFVPMHWLCFVGLFETSAIPFIGFFTCFWKNVNWSL